MSNSNLRPKQDLPNGEDRLSVISASARLGWWDWNIETDDLVWSKECLEMFGLPPETKMSYERFAQAIHPEDRDRVHEAVQSALKTGEEYSVEMRAAWPDGSVHWVVSRGRAYFDKAGKPVRMSGAGMDVTQSKETEENLLRARAEAKTQADNFAAVFDAMPAAAFFSNDRKCEVMISNRAAYDLLRLPYGSNTSKSAPAGERPKFKVLENGREMKPEELPVQQAAATGLPVRDKEFEIQFEDGSSVHEFGHAVPLFDEAGEVRGAVGAFLDITDRKVMEQRLREATERFQVALRNTPITVFSQDLDLRYKWMYNPVTGYNIAEILGKRDGDFLERAEDAEKLESIKSEVMRTGKIYQGEVELSHQGKLRTFHVTIEPQRGSQNNIIGLTCASFDLTDRKAAEAEHARLARQRQLALDAAKMGWWHYDALTKVGEWDEPFSDIFGSSSQRMEFEEILKRIHPDDVPEVLRRFDLAMNPADPQPYVAEYRVVRPDGTVRWVEAYGAAEFKGEGTDRRVLNVAGTIRDITERKEAEARLVQNQEAFLKLVENAPFGVYVVDSQFRIVQMNAGARTGAFRNVQPIMGRDLGEAIRILWPEPLATDLIAIFRHTLETGEPYYSPRFVSSRNDIAVVEAYEWEVHRIMLSGGRYGAVCYYFDSTRVREAEEALLKQRERHEFIAEGSDVGFWFCDLPFNELIWDKRVKKHFGLPENHTPVTMETFYSQMHPEDREPTRRAIENSIENNQQYDVQYRTMAADGRYRWVRANGRTFYDEAGKPVRFDGITQDITLRKQAEEALRESEARYRSLAENLDREVQVRTTELQKRNEEMVRASEGLRDLSTRLLLIQDEERRRIARELHDSAGQLLTALGMELAAIKARARQVAPDLAKQAEGAEDLVQQLHSDIRTTSYLLHPPLLDEAGLSSAVSWYVRGMTERSGIEVGLDMSAGFGRLPRDMELIVFRLVQESLTNIHRHSGSKKAEIRLTRKDDLVTVEVRDDGKGIPPRRLAEIRSGGSGVGIRGMRERLHQLKGEFRIESSPSGTQILATIPISPVDQESSGMEPIRAAM